MVTFSASNLVSCIPSRARHRVQGSTFATIQRTFHQRPFLLRSASHSQVLQGKSKPSARRLHRADHSNQQYSILAISDTSGAVVERVAYQAYGQPTFTNAAGTTLSSSAKATRYSYTGREWDPSLELHHFRARWMRVLSGRFSGRDPIGYTSNLNLSESRVGISEVDPSGKITLSLCYGTCSQSWPDERDACRRSCQTCGSIFNKRVRFESSHYNERVVAMALMPSCPRNVRHPRIRLRRCRDESFAFSEEVWELPQGDVRGTWRWDAGVTAGYGYHPGATACMRFVSNGAAEQQCCYDDAGSLITSGTGAGSPDINNPDHVGGKVNPFYCALRLNGNRWHEPYTSTYDIFRPTNNRNGCTSNHVDRPTAPIPSTPTTLFGVDWWPSS